MPGLMRRTMLLASVWAASACGAPFAYGPNEGAAWVSGVDTASDKVVRTFKVGTRPRGVALALDGKRLYISDQTSNSLLTFDTATGEAIARAPLGESRE